MSIRLPAARLLPASHACYYLTGEDHDGVFEAAEQLLADEIGSATLLRVDVNELSLIHENLQPGLFGESACHAMVRNAGSARPRQIDQLEKLAADPPAGLRLIICAPGIESRKALHKRFSALPEVVHCQLDMMNDATFERWLVQLAEEAGLKLGGEALALIAGQLGGMRMAARQAVERLRLYDNGQGDELGVEVVGDLLGERAPADLSELCRAVGERSPLSLSLLRSLLREQQVAEVQVFSWITTRLQQLLLYAWFAKTDRQGAARKAGVFGEAVRQVPSQSANWKPRELMQAMCASVDVEMKLKGASTEEKHIVLERYVLSLLDR